MEASLLMISQTERQKDIQECRFNGPDVHAKTTGFSGFMCGLLVK